MLRLLRGSEAQFLGKQCCRLMHRVGGPPKGCPMKAMLASGRFESSEMKVEALGRFFLVSCSPVFDSQGRLHRIIHTATDITERRLAEEARKKAEAALRRAHDELERRVKARTKQLEGANEELRRQMAERLKAEAALRDARLKLINAREEERKRLSRELHDSIGQSLVAAELKLKALSAEAAARKGPASLKAMRELSRLHHDLSEELRRISRALYPQVLEALGLCAALRQLARDMHSPQAEISVRCHRTLGQACFAKDVEIAVYRVAQESLANALRHGRPKHVVLALSCASGRLRLSVTDDGIGFAAERGAGGNQGLNSMQDRADSIGARLRLTSRPGRTRVEMVAPASRQKKAR
jgi:signal transduction histidine kinase